MDVPRVRAGLLCEFVRNEVQGKLSALGLFGVLPAVEVFVPSLPANIAIAFIFFWEPPPGEYAGEFRIRSGDEQLVSVTFAVEIEGDSASSNAKLIIPTQVLKLSDPGKYDVVLLIDKKTVYDSSFSIKVDPDRFPKTK